MLADSRQPLFRSCLLGLSLLTAVSCTSLRAPADPPHLASEQTISAKSDGIDLRVTPVNGLPTYQELFKENLPAIGIAAVWVSMRNEGSVTVDLSHSKWTYHRDGKKYRSLSTSDLFARYYSARHIRTYTLHVDEEARHRAEKLMFRPARLTPGMEQNGFVYFGINPAWGPDWATAGLLLVQNIRGQEGRKLSIGINLSNANP